MNIDLTHFQVQFTAIRRKGRSMMKRRFVQALVICMAVSVLAGCDYFRRLNEEKLSLGTWKNNVYTSTFVDVSFTLPEGWIYASEEEIAAEMNLKSEWLSDEGKHLSEVAKLTSVFDMAASDPATDDQVKIMMEKLYAEVSMDTYVEAFSGNLKNMVVSYETAIGPVSTQEIAGHTYTSLMTSVAEYDMEQQYFFRKEGSYMIVILLANMDASQGSMTNILDAFSVPE
jgi:hypothetical protein